MSGCARTGIWKLSHTRKKHKRNTKNILLNFQIHLSGKMWKMIFTLFQYRYLIIQCVGVSKMYYYLCCSKHWNLIKPNHRHLSRIQTSKKTKNAELGKIKSAYYRPNHKTRQYFQTPEVALKFYSTTPREYNKKANPRRNRKILAKQQKSKPIVSCS